jgi:hypothetical protein
MEKTPTKHCFISVSLFPLFGFYFGTGVEDKRTIINYVGFNCVLVIYLKM